MEFKFFMPARILFGRGQVKSLHNQALPGKKALIVISNGRSARANGYLDTVQNELSQAGIEYAVFDGITANPTRRNVMDGAAAARENNCDFILGLGGGSPLDAAKVIAAMAANPGDVWDYISGGTGKGLPLVNEPLPIVLITTTAGTGTEADAYGVVTNEETNEKIGFGGMDSLFPRFAIVDPELMITVPPLLTAYQGFDALFHSAEAYVSRYASDYSDMFALTAIEAIAGNLGRAVRNGADIEARERMAYANTLSGIVMTISVTTSHHSIEHALSAEHHDLPHGAGLIMISRSWFGFMAKSGCCDEKLINMAKVMGKTDANRPADFVDVLAELQKSCGVADLKMSDYGITKAELPRIARQARITNPFLFTADPATLTDEDVAGILEDAWR